MGSKARLSKDIVPLINSLIEDNHIKMYVEPFVGGANIIDKIICDRKIGLDINEYLIEMWKKLIEGWIPPSEISKELYNDIKQNKDNYNKELVSIVGFCSSFRGKWFGGYAGITKSNNGKIRNYYDESIRNISKQINSLKDVEFKNSDYKEGEYSNSLIYCDPPYENTTKYDANDSFNHVEFWEWVRKMSKTNIVLISEYNAPIDFKCIYKKELTTSLDSKSSKKACEKIFMMK
jgi:DNA adenine methylase